MNPAITQRGKRGFDAGTAAAGTTRFLRWCLTVACVVVVAPVDAVVRAVVVAAVVVRVLRVWAGGGGGGGAGGGGGGGGGGGAVVVGAVVVGAVVLAPVVPVGPVAPVAAVVRSAVAVRALSAAAKPAAARPAAAATAATRRRKVLTEEGIPTSSTCQAHAMAQSVVVIRHGETDWSAHKRHTGRTDVPLTEEGRHEAEQIGRALRGWRFALVLTSPLKRAVETCWLTGYGDRAVARDQLMEWDYGEYEGRTTLDIRQQVPDWTIWRYGAPGGESPEQVGARADLVLHEIRSAEGDVLVFSHGHFLRALAARWLGLQPSEGRLFALDPATLSILGYEREQPVLSTWNQRVVSDS
jgi:probable phosphoglycerate mutase